MKRFLNAAVALAVTLVTYQVYVLAVVPIVEPTLAVREYDAASEDDWQGGTYAVARWQKMLRSYLPAGHWALTGTPQVYEYEPMVLVLDDFRPVEGGRIELTKCLLLAFPTQRVRGEPPPRDAIIVEAPDRAIIQFDRLEGALDFTSGQIGRPIAGQFPGQLVIRSDMREAGPHDDLRIVTRDLWFDLSKIATNAEVDLRIGPHHAHGRELEIQLLKEQHASASKMPIAGVRSLEIREQVRATIDVGNLDAGGALRPERRVTSVPAYGVRQVAAQSPLAPLAGDGPLELTSAGSFLFDFTRFVAKIEKDVRATLPRADGSTDRLFCRELRVHFGEERINPADEPDLARQQSRKLSELQPRLVEAIGSPVRLESPGQQAAVRGQRLRAWIADRRVQIAGTPAQLAHGLSEVQAPLLDYTAPPADSPRVIGELLASGPGWMRLTPVADRPDRSYEARWSEAPDKGPVVRLGRDGRDHPLLTMTGRPEFAAAGFGKLRADELTVQMREVPADGRDGPAIELASSSNDRDAGAVLLKRIDATGSVEFLGRQIEGRADDLAALLRPMAATNEPNPGGPSLGSPVGFASPKAEDNSPSDRRFRLQTKSIQVDVGLAGRRATPLSVVCSGGVRLDGEPTADGKAPLKIVGRQLRADRLDRKGGARLTIAGDDSGQANASNDQEGLAEISAQGIRVWVRDLHVDQAAGRVWTEGRGDARLAIPARRGALPIEGEASLRWRGGMDFDGRRLTLKDEVFAETAGGWLNCGALSATLSRPIDLRGGSFRGGAVDVEQVASSESVTIDYRSTDEVGQRSHERARLSALSFNRLTGAIGGQGPGSVRSVRLGGSGPSLPGQPAKPAKNDQGLKYLRVDFRDTIAGNLNDRALRFRGRVQTVYGPVLAWEHQLPLRSPEGVPPDAVELQCEELRVHEDPAATVARGSAAGAPIGPIELQAREGVRIEATIGEKGGALIAEAATASYSQSADRFVLAGDGQQMARLSARPDATQPFVPATAGRLTHYLSLGRTKIEDLRGVEYQPAPSASRPGLPRR